jgi:protein-L-isoaspartate(D-aspartate) O-methyltransferase
MTTTHQFDLQARHMVEEQLRPRGIHDERVLEAMRAVPRQEFVPAESMGAAYEDRPLPIGARETISQPYIVALMAEAARVVPGDHALEVGGGSGYLAAILSHLGATVCMVERNTQLADESRERLSRLGFENIEVFAGDGSEGLVERAPFNVIIVSAATPSISPVMLSQLAEGARLVAPVGSLHQQDLQLICREEEQMLTRSLGACQFVPLVGNGGWREKEVGITN